ncbi:GntR family transcriptional regulator [Pseudarthrobacter sp. MDT3-9]|nr:GntR family transcriptional regulator [Pseudarthrobacter sp. MDT3-9]
MTGFATRYQVNLSVVREAMIRLAGDGLVKALPQRGFCVSPLSPEDLLDLTRSQVLIETVTLRKATDQGDLAWESAVIAAHHTLQKTTYTGGEGQFHGTCSQAHNAFHRALLEGAGSPRLESTATKLRDCSLLYRHWSLPSGQDPYRDAVNEDRTIAELAVARDGTGAAAALKEHFERATAVLLAYSQQTNAALSGGSMTGPAKGHA